MIKNNKLYYFFLLFLFVARYSCAGDNDIKVNFTGSISVVSCEVDSNSVAQTINLNRLYNKNLSDPGDASDWVPVNVTINNCTPAVSSVTATMSGTRDTDDNTLYKNTGDAKNVAVELQGTDGTVYGSGSQVTLNVTSTSHSATFNLRTRAKTVLGDTTPGSILAVIQLSFNYQ